jgi:hypothetical protein
VRVLSAVSRRRRAVTDTAEDIVRALARSGPPMRKTDSGESCAFRLCSARSMGRYGRKAHARNCEYLRAVEWVEANPK